MLAIIKIIVGDTDEEASNIA